MFQDLRFWYFWNVLPVKVQMVADILKALILARRYCIPSQKLSSPLFVFPLNLGMVFDHPVLYPLHKVKVGINILDENINLLNLTGYVMHQQFNIQQLYALSTLHLCVLYLSENKQ
jgi:hypothetical protein